MSAASPSSVRRTTRAAGCCRCPSGRWSRRSRSGRRRRSRWPARWSPWPGSGPVARSVGSATRKPIRPGARARRDEHGDPDRHAQPRGQQRRGVRADGEQRAVAERDLALVADQHVQPDRGDGVEGDRSAAICCRSRRRARAARRPGSTGAAPGRVHHDQSASRPMSVRSKIGRRCSAGAQATTLHRLRPSRRVTRSNRPSGRQARMTIRRKNVTASRNEALKIGRP